MNGPLHSILLPLTYPSAQLYGWVVQRRNHRYDQPAHVTTLHVPVISVGNITVGGAGKTPMVAWIVSQLIADGHTPLIAMRGYGARPDETSDEQAEYADSFPDVPVVAQPDRIAGINAARTAGTPFDCIVLDDGFQHRRIHRDLDLVLIDATRPGIDGHVLPAGWLREPASNLARADAVIVTRSPSHNPDLTRRIQALHGRAPVAWSQHAWTNLVIRTPAPRDEPLEWLRGKRVVTMLGVGNPGPMLDQVREAGATIATSIPVADHQRYDPRLITTLQRVAVDTDAIVMTRKDWVKVGDLIDSNRWQVPIVTPNLSIDLWAGHAELLAVIRGVLASRPTSPDTTAP